MVSSIYRFNIYHSLRAISKLIINTVLLEIMAWTCDHPANLMDSGMEDNEIAGQADQITSGVIPNRWLKYFSSCL